MIYLIFLTSLLFAQAPPPSLRGQEQTVRLLPKPNLQVPYSQATNLGGLDALIETGSENYLSNSNFEHQTVGTSWTIVPTSSAITTGVQSGRKAIELTPSAYSGAMITQSATPANITLSGNIEHSVWVRTSLSNIQVCAMQATNEVQCVDVAPTNTWNKYELNVAAPASGSVGVRVKSTASVTGSVFVDNAYVGPSRSIGSVAQAQALFRATRATSAQTISSAATHVKVQFNSEVFDSNDEYDLTNFRFRPKAPGNYLLNASIGLVGLTAGERYLIVIARNGNPTVDSDVLCTVSFNAMVTVNNTQNCTALVSATNGTDFFEVFVRSDADTSFDVIQLPGTSQFFASKLPSQSEIAIRPNVASFYVDANLATQAGLTLSSISTYTEITDSSSTLTPASGSAPVGVMCSSTNAAATPSTSPTNCSAGNESIGFNVVIPSAGLYEVCGYFSVSAEGNANSSAHVTFQWVETATNAQTILQEGRTRTTSRHFAASTVWISKAPHSNCSIFNFTTPGVKGLRLMREQEVSGTLTSFFLDLLNPTSIGQPDIRITMKPFLTPTPAPLLTGSVTSNSSGLLRIEAVKFNCSSSSSITSQTSSFVSSVGNISSGACAVNFAAGSFSSAPYCVPVLTNIGAAQYLSIGTSSITTSGLSVYGHGGLSPAILTNYNVEMICYGAR